MNRFPLNGTFELTARCNLRCKMCLVRVDEPRIRELGTRELTAAEWIDLARQAADMGTLNLLLTGGEPMFRKDFCEIYKAVSQMGFLLTLYTNATRITPEIQALLVKYPPHNIGVTIYGASEATYGRLCGVPDAFHRTLEGIDFLRTLPSKLELRTTYVKDNIDDMRAIRELVTSIDTQLPLVASCVVSKAVRGGISDAVSCRLSPNENVKMLVNNACLQILAHTNNGQSGRHTKNLENARLLSKTTKDEKSRDTIYGCQAGVSQFTISWNGRLIACQLMNEEGGDVLVNGLRNAWDTYPSAVSSSLSLDNCQSCIWRNECISCPATRKAEASNIDGVPEYYCKISEQLHCMKFQYKK